MRDIVNGRTIRAKVVEQEAARKIAMRKKAEGHRTALVEMERGNLFTLSLGNVQPDDVIVIRFAYFEELDAWRDEMALQISFCAGGALPTPVRWRLPGFRQTRRPNTL